MVVVSIQNISRRAGFRSSLHLEAMSKFQKSSSTPNAQNLVSLSTDLDPPRLRIQLHAVDAKR